MQQFQMQNEKEIAARIVELTTDLVAEDTKIYVEDATKLPLVSRNADML